MVAVVIAAEMYFGGEVVSYTIILKFESFPMIYSLVPLDVQGPVLIKTI